MSMHVASSVCLLLLASAQGRRGVGDVEQDWGYITVRPNAHMFWWLYYTTYNVSNYTDRPLIMWLQGGPGMSSSGFGNFMEIGPLDVSLTGREASFVEKFNVLFVDNPVGVGFSFISNNDTSFARNNSEIGEDLYNFFKEFIAHHPEFKNVPFYVFGESYGGKMATEFVYNLKQKEKSSNQKWCNLTGLALGDAYISPIDILHHYAPLALNLGIVDQQKFTKIDSHSKEIKVLISREEFEKAATLQNEITNLLCQTFGLELNNILVQTNMTGLPKSFEQMFTLEELMNGKIKKMLGVPEDVVWKYLQDDLYEFLRDDLMRSVTDRIETILNTTDVKIIVYNGILDFLVNTAGTLSWLDNLNWTGKHRWYNANQIPLIIDMVSEGYFKQVDNLVFYAILRAGHSVPVDNLRVLNAILEKEIFS